MQLDHLFAALKPLLSNSQRQNERKRHTRSTAAYQCFHTGLAHYLDGKANPSRNDSSGRDDANPPKRNAKLVGIYLSNTDVRNLIKLDSI